MTITSHANPPEDRLSRVEAIAEANAIAIRENAIAINHLREENAIAINHLREEAADCRNQLREEAANFRAGFSELREGNALLAQFLVEQRELNAEFRRNTNAALDRIDRTLAEFRKTLDYLLRKEGGNPGEDSKAGSP